MKYNIALFYNLLFYVQKAERKQQQKYRKLFDRLLTVFPWQDRYKLSSTYHNQRS